MRNDEKTDKQGQNRGAFVSGFRSRWSSRRSQTEVLAWLCDRSLGPKSWERQHQADGGQDSQEENKEGREKAPYPKNQNNCKLTFNVCVCLKRQFGPP